MNTVCREKKRGKVCERKEIKGFMKGFYWFKENGSGSKSVMIISG